MKICHNEQDILAMWPMSPAQPPKALGNQINYPVLAQFKGVNTQLEDTRKWGLHIVEIPKGVDPQSFLSGFVAVGKIININ